MSKQTFTAVSNVTDRRIGMVVILSMGVCFILAVLSGLRINHEVHSQAVQYLHLMKPVHLCSGLGFIVFAGIHIYMKRNWYYKLLQPANYLSWNERAQCRLMSIFTLLFGAVSITAVLMLLGIGSLRDFHQGCGLLFSLFALLHIAVRLRNIK